ncbi:MAG: type II toxin-antitoxin system RelE/ParE family toxin [Bacteroidales bacterium]
MDYKLLWSKESIRKLEEILDDIIYNWTDKEVDDFKNKLSHQLDLIIQNPLMFPASTYNPRLRKAVLSKQTTIYYEIIDDIIYLAYLHLNKKAIRKIK